MNIIIGFFIMLVMIAISSIPTFLTLWIKKEYGNITAWILCVSSVFIYIVLKSLCIISGVLNSKGAVPIFAMFILYSISRLGVVENKQT